MTYLTLETESDYTPSEHEVSDEEEWAATERQRIAQEELSDEERLHELSKMIICSCGHYTCSELPIYGHPVPIFKENIEPLWPQSVRDNRALQLKDTL